MTAGEPIAPAIDTLAGQRCTLRALTPADAPAVQRHADDEGVGRHLFEGFPRPYTLADAQAWCGPMHREPAFGHVWGIEAEGEVVGTVGVRPDAGWLRCNAEVGYWIGRAFWRRGIASEALALVTGWAWRRLPELTRLYASIFAGNEGSLAVTRRCGYVLEGRLPRSAIKDGRVIDRVLVATYRPDARAD